MTLRSLRLRLFLFAFAGITATLILAGIGLTSLFERHVERRIGDELDTHIAQLAGSLRVDAKGALSLARKPADPRFDKVFGGLYWQIQNETTGALLRSRSLWDSDLALPADAPPVGLVHVHNAKGPDGKPLIVHERRLILDGGSREVPVRIDVAINHEVVDTLRAGFARDLLPGLSLLGVLLLAGLWFQVRAGLAPLGTLQDAIREVRSGAARRLSSDVPEEVEPLVGEVNSLLDAQEAALKRAHDRAGDLAHGLKTPLTALASDVRRLRQAGENAIADDIQLSAQIMHRHIERELARTRLRHQHGQRLVSRLAPAASAIVKTVARTPHGEHVAFEISVHQDTAIAFDPDDLNDVLGNLVENAARYARAQVRVSAVPNGSGLMVRVEDDGPGVAPEDLDKLFERGRRLDEKGGSAGLGLAIVQDILTEYGTALKAGNSELGGLALNFTVRSVAASA